MEKKQIRFLIGIQKRNTKKVSNGQLDTKRLQKDRQKRYAREVFRKEVRRAFMSGWKQGVQYGENLKADQQKEVGVIDGKSEW